MNQRFLHVVGDWRIFEPISIAMGTVVCRISSIVKPSKLLLFNSIPSVWVTLLSEKRSDLPIRLSLTTAAH